MNTNNKQFNMYGYKELVNRVFKKIYPIIARQIIEYTEIKEGICLDIGSGTGDLGIEIAKLTNMKVYLMDINLDGKDIANEKIKDENLENRVLPIVGDVHNISFADNSIDLIVSRSSYRFWKDKTKAFKEIYRVLRKGGKAYIGKGYGSKNLKEEIERNMFKINPEKWYPGKKEMNLEEFKKYFYKALEENQISKYNFISNKSGNWLVIEK
ncbi:MAG: class I SAM-dependent methyltransferase [Miniphocaeibacter sp.]|uniref:class I SAM-dependent methyltransferase n=1 Tax=Miniphocaeibacter sp. TaxID=3100973 RepID=UPI003BAE88F4